MKRFKNILLIADPNTDVAVSFRRALSLAKQNKARLTVLDVVDQLPSNLQMMITIISPSELQKMVIKERLSQLEKLVSPARKKGIRISTKVLSGTPFLEIVREALRNRRDLVIKSAEGKGLRNQLLFGSIDLHLMRKCPCPVWIIKSSKRKQCARILAAVDPNPSNEQAKSLNTLIMDLATSLAIQDQSELHIIHAWEMFAEEGYLHSRCGLSSQDTAKIARDKRAMHKGWLGNLLEGCNLEAIDHHVHLLKGDPSHVISEFTRKKLVELLVMGTVVRTGIPGFLIGNTAERVLNQVNCSVLTVKPEEFVSPVVEDK